MQVKISIVVPIYNVEKEFPRCIESIIKQTYENIEILLVDDGSPDKCPELCEKYAAQDARIIVIHKENGGLSDARNHGLQAAKGDYVLYVDSDDFIALDSCERFAKIAEAMSPDIVVGEARLVYGNNVELMHHNNLEENHNYTSKDYVMLAINARQWYAPSWLNLYRRQYLLNNNLFFKKGILHEDMEFLPRVFLQKNKIAYFRYAFYSYIVRENSITQSQKSKKNAQHLIEIYNGWKTQFDTVKDAELRKLLYGMLIKHYLHTCKEYKVVERNLVKGINRNFVLRNGLSVKEKIKGMIYVLVPGVYVRL